MILFTADWHIKLGQKNVPVAWACARYKMFFEQIQEIEKAFGKEAQLSKDYGRIIHQKHFEKLVQDLNKQTLLYGGDKNKEDLFFGPTLVDEPELDSSLLMDEIFGPILPILSYNTEADLDLVLTKLKNPLAFYIFSSQKKFINALVQRYAFGGGVINDSIIHFTNDKLPFGGVGPSGIGSYHGEDGFKTFSNPKAIYKQVGSRFDKLLSAIRPPYKGDIEKVLKQIT
mgnify:CR=1 FL=1